MTIKEMETKLNIPRATIRFYEKERLITPVREENGYRDYSKDDLEKVEKIVILRKIGFSVNDIFRLESLAYHSFMIFRKGVKSLSV